MACIATNVRAPVEVYRPLFASGIIIEDVGRDVRLGVESIRASSDPAWLLRSSRRNYEWRNSRVWAAPTYDDHITGSSPRVSKGVVVSEPRAVARGCEHSG